MNAIAKRAAEIREMMTAKPGQKMSPKDAETLAYRRARRVVRRRK